MNSYPFLLHVDDQSPVVQTADAEELNVAIPVQPLRFSRRGCRRALILRRNQSFDVVGKEILRIAMSQSP